MNHAKHRQLPVNRVFLSSISILIFSFSVLPAIAGDVSTKPDNVEKGIFDTEISQRIIGGTLSKEGDWPWMAGIQLRSNGVLFCGGSLIKDQWVLTAGHCLYDIFKRQLQPDDIEILIGQTKLSSSSGERKLVQQVIIHPNYNQFLPESAFDIALLKLQTPSSIPPIQTLGNFSVQDDPGKPATVLGWGTISASEPNFPDALHQVTLPIISNQVCDQAMGGVIKENMLCAGFVEGGKDSCIGDSGGPLVVFDTESQTWRQAGITSFGIGCAEPGLYGVYTRLERFKDFISSSICSSNELPGTPELDISIDNRTVTASWNPAFNAEGYRLNYAPYPDLFPIYSLDMNKKTSLSVELNSGDAFFVAINSYSQNCRSNYSNIEYFIVP